MIAYISIYKNVEILILKNTHMLTQWPACDKGRIGLLPLNLSKIDFVKQVSFHN